MNTIKQLIDMDSNELFEIAMKKEYKDNFIQFFTSIDVSPLYNRYLHVREILDVCVKKGFTLENFYIILKNLNYDSSPVLLYDKNLLLEEISNFHILLMQYYEQQDIITLNGGSLINHKKLKWLKEYIVEIHFYELNYLLRRIDYRLKESKFCEWWELDKDDTLTRLENVSFDKKESDNVIQALITTHSNNIQIQDSIEFILVKYYFERNEYLRILNLINRRPNPMIDKYYFIFSLARTGKVKELFNELENVPVFNEYNLFEPLFELMINLDLKNYETYESGLNDIRQRMTNLEDRIIPYRMQEFETKDKSRFYSLVFRYLTEWIERYDDCNTLNIINEGNNNLLIQTLEDKKNIFKLVPMELSQRLNNFFNSDKQFKERYKLYMFAFENIDDLMVLEKIELLINSCKVGIGQNIFQLSSDYISNIIDHISEKENNALQTLVILLYLDSLSIENDKYSNIFREFLYRLGIPEKEIENDRTRKIIIDSLSMNGKFEYRSACMLFDLATESEYSNNDAGMIAMSFYRILENESNEQFWIPIARKLGKNGLNNLFGDEKKKNEWSVIYQTLYGMAEGKKRLLMFGNLRHLFRNLNDNSIVGSKLKKEIENLLTDEGKKMYMNVFSQWYEYERVQKYRNPPAHNCYLSLEVAKESKNYVEQQLLILRNLIYKTDYNG